MTPRQIMAWLMLVDRRENVERAFDLAHSTMAARGDAKKVGEELRKLTDED
jgi:hypothetical protein